MSPDTHYPVDGPRRHGTEGVDRKPQSPGPPDMKCPSLACPLRWWNSGRWGPGAGRQECLLVGTVILGG